MRLRHQTGLLNDYAEFMSRSMQELSDMKELLNRNSIGHHLEKRPEKVVEHDASGKELKLNSGSSSQQMKHSYFISDDGGGIARVDPQRVSSATSTPPPDNSSVPINSPSISGLIEGVFTDSDAFFSGMATSDPIAPGVVAGAASVEGVDDNIGLLGQVKSLTKMAGILGRPHGKGLFRSLSLVIQFIYRVQTRIRRRLDHDKQGQIGEFTEVIDLYEEMTRSWLAPAIKYPIGSLVSPSSTIILRPVGLSPSGPLASLLHKAGRRSSPSLSIAIQISVRLKHICDTLVELTAPDVQVPTALIGFVNRYLISSGLYFPPSYLFPSESRLLQYDHRGATAPLSDHAKQSLLVNYFITRVLVAMILKPWEMGIGKRPKEKQTDIWNNLKVMASVMYEVVNGDGDDPDHIRRDFNLLDHNDPSIKPLQDAINENRIKVDTFIRQLLTRV
uniref:Uncharacterized protein n=1 Tax=Spongospora subterranea TaxID=70186 RepID=A0A0H5QFU3_9EUKA|eukprot:CRZ00805.1 hypothetical protein [Spongospora subterranea]